MERRPSHGLDSAINLVGSTSLLANLHRAVGHTAEHLINELLALLRVREVRNISLWVESERRDAIGLDARGLPFDWA